MEENRAWKGCRRWKDVCLQAVVISFGNSSELKIIKHDLIYKYSYTSLGTDIKPPQPTSSLPPSQPIPPNGGNENCVYTAWSSWTQCASRTCGVPGMRRRNHVLVSMPSGQCSRIEEQEEACVRPCEGIKSFKILSD